MFTKEQIIERGGSWEEVKAFMSKWSDIGDVISSTFDFINNLPDNMPLYTVQLLAKVFELLSSTVLYTPLILFTNSVVKDTSLVFAGISILIVTILTMIEGIKKMIKKKNTDIKEISKRYFLAIMGAGFAPFLFEKVFSLINQLTKAISKIGTAELANFDIFTKNVGLLGVINGGFLETTLLLIFDLVVIGLLIPIILQTGRRWWDLLTLSAITPLSLTAWIFDDYKHYFTKWWSNVKVLAQTQLIYAIYICLMGVFIFGTTNITSGIGLLTKLLLIVGGLFRMSNVPSFISSKVDKGNDIEDSFMDTRNNIKNLYDTLTFKNTRTLKYFTKKNEENMKNIQKLRKKHGQRHVKGLS